MSVLHLADDAYASAIRQDIEQRGGRAVSRGAVYITLERLAEKGLLTSTLGGDGTSRGGRPTRTFRATPAGVKALKRTMSLVARMQRGLEPILGDL